MLRELAEYFKEDRATKWMMRGSAILILGVLVGAGLVLSSARSRAISAAGREMRSLSLVLAEQLDSGIQSIEILERSIFGDSERSKVATEDGFRETYSSRSIHHLLKDSISALPHVAALSLRDVDGSPLSSSSEWPARDDEAVPGAMVLTNEMTGDTFIGPPVKSIREGIWSIYLARRISSGSGRPLGFLLGSIEVRYLEDLFAKVLPNPSSSILLFRSDGTLLARYPSQRDALGKVFAARTLIGQEPVGGAREIRIASPIDGREKIIASRRLDHYPAYVLISTTLDEALADWRKTALYLGGGSIVVIAALSYIVVLSRRRFLGELRVQNEQFASALNNIPQGLIMLDQDARVVISNRRYAEMYGLPRALTKPGAKLEDILRARKLTGTFFGSPDEQVKQLVSRIGSSVEARDVMTRDGRHISILSTNTAGGGWVATHEDISDRVRREASFRLLFENNPVPMLVYDLQTLDIIAVNEAAIAFYGYTRAEFAGLKVLDIRPAGTRDRFKAWLSHRTKVESSENVWQHLTSSGQVVEVNIFSQALAYEGREARLVAVHDVTDQRRAEEELVRTKNFLDAVIENVPLPIVVRDATSGSGAADCRFSLLNKAAEELFGIDRTDWIGRTLKEIIPDGQPSILREEACLTSEIAVIAEDRETFNASKGRRLVTSKHFVARNISGHAEHLIAVLEDVTERREAERRIAYMARHDVLTGLANRGAFDEEFASTLERANSSNVSVSVLCMDLDGFKEINDTHGHSAGDAVLRWVGERLTKCASGAFIARFGGDEFAIIVEECDKGLVAEKIAVSILRSIKEGFQVAGHDLEVAITIGIARFPEHGRSPEVLLSNADVALYRAKVTDPGTVQMFATRMGTEVRDRRAMHEDLKKAVAAGSLTLNYQPQALEDRSVIGFEALARWHCAKRGVVSPADFIDVAEETNLILSLGEWVLRTACSAAATWMIPYKIAVNVSPKQFRHGNLPQLVHAVLLETGLSPDRLELEITEGVLIGDFSRALSVLNQLKALGVDISLDDFGTGYSSLSYLHSFPFDMIKIDRAFISDVITNRHSKAIVRAVIGLGRSLGVPILAEGVETQEQREFLFREGCQAVQGYLDGKPLPASGYAHMFFPSPTEERRRL